MNKLCNAVLVCALVILCHADSTAQAYVEDISLIQTPIQVDRFGMDSVWNYAISIRLSDTLQVNKLYLRIGASEHATDFLNCEFYLNDPGLNDSCATAFSLDGIHVLFDLGNTGVDGSYYYEVELEDALTNKYALFIKQLL